MRTLIVGINLGPHDTAIFVADPERRDRFAISTERLTRFKHDWLYPLDAFRRYLGHANLDPRSVERLIVADCYRTNRGRPAVDRTYEFRTLLRQHFGEPYLKGYEDKLDALLAQSNLGKLLSLLKTASGRRFLAAGIKSLLTRSTLNKDEIRDWISNVLMIDQETAQKIMDPVYEPLAFRTLEEDVQTDLQLLFPDARIDWEYHDHHLCHAVSAYYSAPFDRSLVVTTDHWGDTYFTKVFTADERGIEEVSGSRVVMLDIIADKNGMARPDDVAFGSLSGLYSQVTKALGFRMNCDEGKVEALAAYEDWDNPFYEELLSVVTLDEEKLEFSMDRARARDLVRSLGRYVDLLGREKVAAATQRYLESFTIRYVSAAMERTACPNLCMSGGAAANVVVNMKLFESVCGQLHVSPAMGDDGAAEGAALLSLRAHYATEKLGWLKGVALPYWGTSYTRGETQEFLEAHSEALEIEDLGDRWPEVVARRIAGGQIGAIFQGRMEWGPRALGNRSILADARNPDARDILNEKIKRRPRFQPFCPSILLEEMGRLFERAYANKHMTCAFQMREEFLEMLPSAVHIDGSARVQFVEEKDNPEYYRLLKELKQQTGFGVCINTSFNRHGRTIVESPSDAITDFLDSGIDFVCINGYLCQRRESRE
ncbi:hypothetical protein MYX76_13485 [Desulfobacterota bacterium AH_259_B03_O07]|nr:hypothetical protein [Desulfobacterota bacterium AH_259_B03_O07]